MAKRNYLVEGGTCTGKSSVCRELRKRGHQAIDGDNELAYQGNPENGRSTAGVPRHEQHIWNVAKVRELAASQTDDIAFFCGGSRNFHKFLDVFDKVIVLDVDIETLKARLTSRTGPHWGGTNEEKAFILHLHTTKEDLPQGTAIDATHP